MKFQMPKRAQFITLEGLDGAGKGTHLEWLVSRLQSRGVDVLATREPGGTPIGEHLRELLLRHSMALETETLLMFAARMEHVKRVIDPALAAGSWVVCDRFSDATYAYQGGGRGLKLERLSTLESWVHPHLQPLRTYLFDIPLAVSRERALLRSKTHGDHPDRFESESDTFFERTRQAYLARAQAAPQRIRIIDGNLAIEEIRQQIDEDLHHLWMQS